MHMQTPNLKIVHVSISSLKPASYNPRRISKKSLEQLKESITGFSMIDPIIANSAPKRKNVVIGGHMRLKAAKELGHTTIPVVYINIPDLDREKELNLRLNRNTGEWDFSKLKSFDSEFLGKIGFDMADLSEIWKDNLDAKNDSWNEKAELAKIKQPETRLWKVPLSSDTHSVR
jgi:hypothetical protein